MALQVIHNHIYLHGKYYFLVLPYFNGAVYYLRYDFTKVHVEILVIF